VINGVFVSGGPSHSSKNTTDDQAFRRCSPTAYTKTEYRPPVFLESGWRAFVCLLLPQQPSRGLMASTVLDQVQHRTDRAIAVRPHECHRTRRLCSPRQTAGSVGRAADERYSSVLVGLILSKGLLTSAANEHMILLSDPPPLFGLYLDEIKNCSQGGSMPPLARRILLITSILWVTVVPHVTRAADYATTLLQVHPSGKVRGDESTVYARALPYSRTMSFPAREVTRRHQQSHFVLALQEPTALVFFGLGFLALALIARKLSGLLEGRFGTPRARTAAAKVSQEVKWRVELSAKEISTRQFPPQSATVSRRHLRAG